LERLVTNEVTGGDAFKLIDVGTGNSQIVTINQKSIEQIKSFANVSSVEPIINIVAYARKDEASKMDLSFYGTSSSYIEWLGIKTKWGQNNIEAEKANNIVVNTAYLDFLTVSPENAVGKKVSFDLIIPEEITGSEKAEVLNQEYSIVGVIDDNSKPAAYVNYNNLTSLGAQNYSQAKIEVANKDQVGSLRAQIENIGFKTQYVGDTVNQIGEVFGIFKIILAAFGFVALIVAALGMFNTLTISLLERTREIALMKILGMRKKDINRLFLSEAIIFGTVGGVAGIILGSVFGSLANLILNYFAVRAGGDTTSIFYYPFWFMVSMVVFSIVIGVLTGLYPAKRASKLDALDVLRYE